MNVAAVRSQVTREVTETCGPILKTLKIVEDQGPPQINPGQVDTVHHAEPSDEKWEVALPSGASFISPYEGTLKGANRWSGYYQAECDFQPPAWAPDAKATFAKAGIVSQTGEIRLYNDHSEDASSQSFQQIINPNGGSTCLIVLPPPSAHDFKLPTPEYIIDSDAAGNLQATSPSHGERNLPIEATQDGTGVILHTSQGEVGIGWLLPPKFIQPEGGPIQPPPPAPEKPGFWKRLTHTLGLP